MGISFMATIRHTLVELRRLRALLIFCTVISIVASPSSVQAQAWKFEPVLKAGFVVDDNASLSIRTDDEVNLSGVLLDARADIYYSLSDVTSFFLQPRASIRTYSGESEFDSDDFFLRSTFRHRAQSSTFGFRVNFDQQSVRTGERTDSDLNIEDPDEIPDDDTGLVGLDGDRARWRLSPYWNYQLSNVSSIEVGLDYFNTQYDKVFAGSLVDYSDTRINVSHRRSHSNNTTGIITLTGRRFDPDSSLSDNTGFGALAGFERALSEKTRLIALIGAENTDQSTGQSDVEVVGEVTLTRDLETISMFARYQRAVTGNGSGTVEVRDTLNMNFNRRLNERISAGLGVRAYHASQVGSSSSTSDRNYVQLQTKFTWYLTKAFVVEADYSYTVLDRSDAVGERSNSNEVGIWFVYQPRTTPKL